MTRGAAWLVGAALLVLPACASEMYEWGPYEDSVLSTMHDFSERDLLAEIDRLEAYEADLREEDRRPPPGLHAHLGYLQFLAGNGEATLRHFAAEKAFYPESTVFIDGMLERVK
ncbi:MAG: DUF4810 domain-containing protein [Planctomycetes bacterium]|nr:DUF4810 domain-containing protein [Planctomycetota bacterium]